jgi:cupin fold WbuC family metalloprotein
MNNPEVIFNPKDVFVLDEQGISSLKKCAESNERRTARICLHQSIAEPVHQMIIVHFKGVYVRPHRHPEKTESFHLIQGSLLLGVFDEQGKVMDRVVLGEKGEKGVGTRIVARLAKNLYHTVIPLTETVVFHEITNGPFTGTGDSEYPQWAPEPDDSEGIRNFFEYIGIDKNNGLATG